jgi:hypothetical protein
MGVRHKAYKATLDRGYAIDWNDDHAVSYAEEITHEALEPGQAITGNWDTAQTSGGSAPVWALVGAAGSGHAFVVLNTGAATGQSSSMRHKLGGAASNITSPADLTVMTLALEVSAVHSAGNVAEWGLFASATAIFTANQAGAYFRIDNNQLYAVSGTGAAETATLIGAWSQYAHYRIEVNSANIKFYVDDMVNPAATTTTNRPAVDLTAKVSVISANNVDSTLRLDGCALQRLRKQ